MTERVEQPRAMTDMERLCRAICWQGHDTGRCDCGKHGGCQTPAHNFEHSYLPVVRAVLKELREPTPKMLVDAGRMDGWADETVLETRKADECHVEWWQAMIDTILQEEE